MADDQAGNQQADELVAAVAAVKKNPTEAARWDRVDELLETVQRPESVHELFLQVLRKRPSAQLVTEVGQRGVRFYETWYGEDSKELAAWLEEVLIADPRADWAFERLTIAHTVGERWGALLDAYDRAIESADQTSRRMRLLEEAAQVAKDFANQADRAIGYMLRLHALDPDNVALSAGLERLLERLERWDDLVGLWQSRLSMQSPKQAQQTRVRMASTYLQKLGRYAEALAQSKAVLSEAPEHEAAYEVVERVLGATEASAPDRRDALALLRQRHLDAHKPEALVRVLELGLEYAEDLERRSLLRELVERLTDLGNDARASQHQAALVVLEPLPRERDTLRALCERTRDHELFAKTLEQAAERSDQPELAAELLLEAARTLENVIGDAARACALYQRVFASQAPAQFVAEAGRRAIPLLEEAGQEAALLDALLRMSELETEPRERRVLLGKVATLAHKLGKKDAADRAWQMRLGLDSQDLEALEALITSAAEQQRWQALVDLLRQRIQVPLAADRRRQDLGWLASTLADRLGDANAAIDAWRSIEHSYGEDTDTVTALTDLLSRAERWQELAEVLSQAAARQVARFAELQTQLGDAYRTRLDHPELAARRYRAALQVDPKNESARQGQHALLGDARCNEVAAQSLAEAYEHTGEWQKTLSLLDTRLALASSPALQADLLCEAATLYEEHAADPRAALDCLRQAFALLPDNRGLERNVRRLAEGLGDFQTVVAAYRETIARLPPRAPRAAELRAEEAKIHEEHLHDREAAHAAYAEACTIAPERIEFVAAATRLAAELGRWDTAAAHVHGCIAAREALVPELQSMLEGAAAEARAFDAYAEAQGALLAQGTLSGKLQRALYARLSDWHKSRRKDEDAAEASLLLALHAQPGDATLLRALADFQRRAPGAALCDTLTTLFELEPGNLDPLLEAAEVAREAIVDHDKRIGLWQRLYDRAADFLRSSSESVGQASAAHCLCFAMDQLVGAYAERGQNEQALQLLLGAAMLPLEPELRREDLHRAALIAAHDLHDDARAIALYRDLLQSEPSDRVAMAALATLYQSAKRLPELLALKQDELRLERDPSRQLELRLELAGLLGELEARGGRSQVLLDNLKERPGHAPSLSALSALYTSQGKQAALAELLVRQAQQLVHQSDPERGAELLAQAATLYEQLPGQDEAALTTYRELYELDPTGNATAALARLHAARGEHAEAAKWLELRLGTVPPDTRAVTSIELAEALLEAGDRKRARSCLEQALRDTPTLTQARVLLADLYRKDNAHEPLAGLLAEAAQNQTEPNKRLELLREAASLYSDTLGAPERAIEVLEQAVALAPGDRELGVRLAETLAVAGRLQLAAQAFERLIEAFGRRRSPERAELHYRLARVRRDLLEIPRAFEELDAATKMDPSHVPAMHLLAQLSYEQGDLDRAERTYRGLLMLVRRHKPGEQQTLFPSEVFYALSLISAAHGHKAQAEELLESAMETASQHDAEARRFQELLRKHEKLDLLMKLLDAREKLAQSPADEAEILAARAEVLADLAGQHAEAFALLLKALGLAPDDDRLHERALTLAAGLGELDRYLQRLGALSDEAARRRDVDSRRLSARLTMRMGETIERALVDLDRALGLYAKVEASGELLVDAWMAMARVAGARGDFQEQKRVLTQITERGPDQVSVEERRNALFALIELELRHEPWREAGVRRLEAALDTLTDYERAKAVVRAAIAIAPEDVALGQAFERVARAARDQNMLLEHFDRLAGSRKVQFSQLREGIELALRLNENVRAEKLLLRANTLLEGSAGDADRPQKTWVLSRLADCSKRAGDVASAVRYLEQAVRVADEDQAEVLLRSLAHLSSGEGGNLEVAATAYARLLAIDPTDRNLWEPLLGIHRKLGDRARFDRIADQCLNDLISPADRAQVELARSMFLIEVARDERAAVPSLKAVLDFAPGQAQASDLLTQIFQKHGMNDELGDLLLGHFDRARDSGNADTITELGLRIGRLYGASRREAAIDVYRSALEWAPAHGELLRALLSALGPDADARERAETMQALLEAERGGEAAGLAQELSALWNSLGESERALQALELGLAAAPDASVLRDRLETFYTEHGMWQPLATLLVREADRMGKTPQAVARLKNAAAMYREGLNDLEGSAAVLRKALAIVPGDLVLLGELARNLAAAGQHQTAIADVTGLLEAHPAADAGRVELLKVRAELRLATEALDGALADFEEAYAIDAQQVRPALVEALERHKSAAFARGDTPGERVAAMRLVEVLDAGGSKDQAREALSTWVEQTPDDVEALLALARRDAVEGRWEEVVRSSARLLDLQSEETQIDTALSLADAAAKAGHPVAARDGLERVQRANPEHAGLRARLRELYEAIGERHELAGILLADAYAASQPAERTALFQRTARLYLDLGEASAALVPLGEASKLKPDDGQTQLLMIDLSLQLGRMQEAAALLDTAIAAQKRKRTPELAQLYRRMGRMSQAQGDLPEQLKWLNQAVEVDRKSSEIAAELAEAAIAFGDHDVAMKALRAITMMDDPKPISRAMAFLMQARIAQQGGDPRRAQHWARKAKSLDEEMIEADEFLAQLEV